RIPISNRGYKLEPTRSRTSSFRIPQPAPPAEQLLRRQTVPASDCADRVPARRDLPDDPNLLFIKPGAPPSSSSEHFNPLRGPGASIIICDHSKPNGSSQPPSSQITTSFGR